MGSVISEAPPGEVIPEIGWTFYPLLVTLCSTDNQVNITLTSIYKPFWTDIVTSHRNLRKAGIEIGEMMMMMMITHYVRYIRNLLIRISALAVSEKLPRCSDHEPVGQVRAD